MKFKLLHGPSYPAYSKAVSVQQSLNLYQETVETPEGKSQVVLRGRPGIGLFKDLTTIDAAATPVRGLWAGGGRLFAAAGTKFMELDVNGALVGSVQTIASASTPVDILSNRNQLFVSAAGTTYVDNGAGLVANTLAALSGTCDTDAFEVRWVSGDYFDPGMVGQAITIAGSPFTVDNVINPQFLIVTSTTGAPASGQAWSASPVMNASRAQFLDGYFVIARPSSRQINISGLLDGGTWDPLDFAYKEGWPDDLLGIWSEPPLLYLLGTETLEIWRNTGNVNFPLERIDGGFARVGLAATWSPVSIMGRLHMLAGGGNLGQVVAVRMNGVTPERISSYAMEASIREAGLVFPTQGVSFSYVEDGHLFWAVCFDVSAPVYTWVFDATEAQRRPPQECWHQRAMWDGANFQDYIPKYHAFLPEDPWFGMHIVGGSQDGKLYGMSSALYDDDGDDIRYVRTLGYAYHENKLLFHHRFEVMIECGTADPVLSVKLDWSDDNGQTWGTEAGAGTYRTLGPDVVGAFTTRFYTTALGSSRSRVYRLTITGKGRIAIIDATLEADAGQA